MFQFYYVLNFRKYKTTTRSFKIHNAIIFKTTIRKYLNY